MDVENQGWEDEQHRVDNVIEDIHQKQKKLDDKSAELKKNVIGLRENFWEDVTVNLDEPDDVIETQASIKQQAELLKEREQFHGKIGKELKALKRLEHSPYFGRIDFLEDGESEKESIYIGIASLMDQDNEDFLIYDWRAPISSLYYDYSPGNAAYRTISGLITGEMTLKRQFIIRDGNIQGMFDTGITIGDELLQQALGKNASTTMQSIVSTIQQEQNKIIRNERHRYMIVQGVAGSGKTSAAMQRIAYLMYRNRETLTADDIVLFSPNPLFSSYVSNVLPELGETNVKQTTFQEYIESKIENRLTVESIFQHIESKLSSTSDEYEAIKMACHNYKTSPAFKQHLDEFLSNLVKAGLRFKSISFRKQVIISREEIYDYFYSLDSAIAIPNKLEQVAKWILRKIGKQQKRERDKDWVMEQVELLDKEDYLEAHYHIQEQDEDELYADEAEEDFLRDKVVKKAFSVLKKRVKQYQFVDTFAVYKRFFAEWLPSDPPQDWRVISEQTLRKFSREYVTWEDAVAYAYVKSCIFGDRTDRSVRHLFIDEAQDYTPFQFAYIKQQFPYARMTLLGDINQAIYAQAVPGSPLLPSSSEENYERIVLTKSYRPTWQITAFTSSFAPDGDLIEPFERNGNKPQLIIYQEDFASTIVSQIRDLQNMGHETVAIIGKTQRECDILFARLHQLISITQIDEETRSFQKGIVLLPVYLAKGVEFDAVVIPDASEAVYTGEADRALFYTACTRAMHELFMLTKQRGNLFLLETPKDKYDVIHMEV